MTKEQELLNYVSTLVEFSPSAYTYTRTPGSTGVLKARVKAWPEDEPNLILTVSVETEVPDDGRPNIPPEREEIILKAAREIHRATCETSFEECQTWWYGTCCSAAEYAAEVLINYGIDSATAEMSDSA